MSYIYFVIYHVPIYRCIIVKHVPMLMSSQIDALSTVSELIFDSERKLIDIK